MRALRIPRAGFAGARANAPEARPILPALPRVTTATAREVGTAAPTGQVPRMNELPPIECSRSGRSAR